MITKIQSDFDEFPLREINKIEFRSLPDHFVFRYTQEDLLNKIEITKYLKTCGFSSTYEGEISYSINNRVKKVVIKEYFPVANRLCQRKEGADVIPCSVDFEYFRKRFRKEANALIAAPHSNIVKTIGIGKFDENGTTYYVMDYIEGETLRDHIREKGPFSSFRELWKYLRPLCEGLRTVHGEKLIHCDIQPSNIMVGKNIDNNDIRLILIDFGSCVSFEAGREGSNYTVLQHQPHHSLFSPLELVNRTEYYARYGSAKRTDNITPATDIYSLGAVIYFMLIGMKYEILSAEENSNMYFAAKCRDIIENGFGFPSDIDPVARRIIEYAMKPKIDDRPQSMEEFIAFCDKQLEQSKHQASTIVKIKPSITMGELKKQGAITVTIPLSNEILSSEVIEGCKWGTILGDNPVADYYVGDIKFKRITLSSIVSSDGGYELKVKDS